ncbi:MAG TPA: efflux RND transporter periplasmic adaptor subunit [Devosiaceae bacterium]
MAWWKQALVALVIVVIAGAGWGYLFPGGQQALKNWGITLPFSSATNGTEAAAGSAGPGAAPGGAGRGRFGGGFGGRATLVVTQPVGTGVVNDRLNALGDGVALHSVTVTPKASGTLTQILVQSGSAVKAGDVIARLDSDAQQIALDKAKLAFNDAQATVKRYDELGSSSTVTAVQRANAQLALDNAALGVRSAQNDLDDRLIVAPIEGTIGIIQVDNGNAVTTQTVIATIEDRSAILVSFWVPERFTGAVKVGEPISAVAVALPQEQFDGQITAVDNKVDAASGTFEVQASIPNPRDELRPGMSFSVTMTFKGDTFFTIDPLSVQWGSDGAYVWRIKDGKAEKVTVRIVQRNTENVLVAGKLAAGDEVATEGTQSLRPGASVTVEGQGQPGNGATAPAAGGQKAAGTVNGGNRPGTQDSSVGTDRPARAGRPGAAPASGS